MRIRRPSPEVQERARERREREDRAPRLAAEVPKLKTLRLELEEQNGKIAIAGTKHARPIVVASAPALFDIPCTDTECKNGGHDLTREIMDQLKDGQREFSGDSACNGEVSTGTCSRSLHYEATATYGAAG